MLTASADYATLKTNPEEYIFAGGDISANTAALRASVLTALADYATLQIAPDVYVFAGGGISAVNSTTHS